MQWCGAAEADSGTDLHNFGLLVACRSAGFLMRSVREGGLGRHEDNGGMAGMRKHGFTDLNVCCGARSGAS